MQQRISLEPAALKVCIDNSTPPFIFQLPPEQGREILNTAQDSPVFKYPAEITSVTVNTQPGVRSSCTMSSRRTS